MASKFMVWTLRIVLFALIGCLIWFVVAPLFGGSMMDFYIRAFLVMQLIIMFGILRLYNAIVQNTRFVLKLREIGLSIGKVLPRLEQSLKMSIDAMNRNHTSEETLIRTLNRTVEEAQQITERLKK